MALTYNRLSKVIDASGDIGYKNFIGNMLGAGLSAPFLIKSTLHLLSDNDLFNGQLSDAAVLSYINMLRAYFNSCCDLCVKDENIDNKLKYGKIEVYKIDAANGLRYATVKEVEQGVEGLISEYIYPAGQKEYEYLCLLQWTLTGSNYYFRNAGYKLNYDSDGNVLTSFFEMTQMCANKLAEMILWVSSNNESNYNKALKIMDKMRKNGGYKYGTYEKDEIIEDISIKQLIRSIDTMFPRNSTNQNFRKAISLVIKTNRYNARLTPMEVSFLRSTYREFALSHEKTAELEPDLELKEKCERLLKMRYSGFIDSKHFAYTIITTLSKNRYTRCSAKQLGFINDAIEILNSNLNTTQEAEKESENKTDVLDDTVIDSSLAAMSNALANGLFEDDEEG